MTKRKLNGKSIFVFLCTTPALILFLVFMLYPVINVFRMSLYKWGGYSDTRTFVGLNNFKILLKDERFIRSAQNSILLITLVTIITITLALTFAAVLVRSKIKGKGFFRIIFYIPNILSVVVIAAIFSAVYDPTRGILTGITSLFTGGDPVLWLGERKLAIYSIGIAMIWQAVGYYMVMYMAGMSSVPESIYEASSIEGAGGIKQFFLITLPLIWENVRTTLTFYIISNINISFLIVRALTGGGPDGATHVFLSYMYDQAYTNSSYGYGMAIGVIVFLFSFLLSLIINLITKREIITE
ncbi:MAG: sugar ABC transporter permease [Ruminococcaceae bacterium]|nr:sugar ABC transporter permease [Oscillospiraceae bacterium]